MLSSKKCHHVQKLRVIRNSNQHVVMNALFVGFDANLDLTFIILRHSLREKPYTTPRIQSIHNQIKNYREWDQWHIEIYSLLFVLFVFVDWHSRIHFVFLLCNKNHGCLISAKLLINGAHSHQSKICTKSPSRCWLLAQHTNIHEKSLKQRWFLISHIWVVTLRFPYFSFPPWFSFRQANV